MEAICHINKKHAKINEDQQHLCSECCKPFEKISTLMTHVRVDHFKFQPYKCQHCELAWDTEWKLNNHTKKIHPTGDKKYLCDKCEEIFYSTDKLSYHKQMKHTTVLHVCEHCGKAYKNKSALGHHVKNRHENQGSYVCDTCGKECPSKTSLEKHIKYHNLPNVPGAFPCPVKYCGKTFGREGSLKDHMRTHREKKPPHLQCQYCPKKFRENAALKYHEKGQHLGLKNFKCDKCDWTGVSRDKLNIHNRSIHEGVLYYCDYPGCTKSYNLRGNLDAHRFRVHRITRPNAKPNEMS